MSFSAVRPFFRNRLETLGYTEHPDAIDFGNVPSTLLDETFQLETEIIGGTTSDQTTHEFDYSVTLRLFRRGFADPVTAHDTADSDIDTILNDLLPINIRNGTAIKDISPVNINKIPLSVSDDNDLIIEFNFNVKLILCFNNP